MPIRSTDDKRRTYPASPISKKARELLRGLQRKLVERLETVTAAGDETSEFEAIDWLRDGGQHGGGRRYAVVDSAVFNRGSVNFSAVHYDDLPDKRLRSATALSTIIHPQDPRAPSMHMHLSWTELRDGAGYWRLMADLNPSLRERPSTKDYQSRFEAAVKTATGEYFDEGQANGDRYFYIPALACHRGVSHYYLEGHNSGDFDADYAMAEALGEAVIAVYGEILDEALADETPATEAEKEAQLAYHTLYFLQVLTLDRGTTSGLLVHDQNDRGILASLPSRVDAELLTSWVAKMRSPQDQLLTELVDELIEEAPSPVSEAVRQALAQVVRDHYRRHPEALKLQASGSKIPPTVANHKAPTKS